MLPAWVNDTDTLVGLVTGIPIILGWLLSLVGRVIQFDQSSAAPQRRPVRPQGVTLIGAFKTGISNLIIQPEVPFWNDVLKVALVTVVLFGVSIFYFVNRGNASNIPILDTLNILAFYSIVLLAVITTFAWARLFIKMNYLNRMDVDDHP